jgi:hypothetical protein
VFTENCFTQFSPIHELGKFLWQALNFAALRVAGEGALGPGAADGTLGLFLLPAGRPGRRLTRAEDDPTAATVVVLFLLPRG